MKRTLIHILAMMLRMAMGCAGGAGPAWADTAGPAGAHEDLILYEVFVRDFGPRGTLRDVQERLDDIRDLGVNVIWLMPIYPVGEKDRKGDVGSPYAVRDYRKIDPALGTDDDLRELVNAAHERGIRVILDFVPNHCAPDNSFVTEHPEWITRGPDGRPLHPVPVWNDVYDLNYDAPGLRDEIESILHYWLDQFDLDGYRVDVAGMVPADFWTRVLDGLRRQHGDLIFLAEAVGPEYHAMGFDLSYDNPLQTFLWEVANGRAPAHKVTGHLSRVLESYPAGSVLMRFTENHDMDRTADTFPPPTDRVAAALIFTAPGAPMIYAGQESGLTGRPNIFSRKALAWNEGREEVKAWYRTLAGLRTRSPALRRGGFQMVRNGDEDRVVSFLRRHADEELLVVLNFGDRDYERLALHDILRAHAVAGWQDALSGAAANDVSDAPDASDGRCYVALRPHEARILRVETKAGD